MKNIEKIKVEKEYAIKGSTYYVAQLRYLSKFGADIQSSYLKITDYKYFSRDTVVVEFIGSKKEGPSKEQIDAFDRFLLNEEKIAEAVRENIYNFYKEVYPDYYEGAIDDDPLLVDEFLPKIIYGNELDDRIKLNSILIHPSIGGVSKIGLNFYCAWDEEHGLGVLIENESVVKTGIADTAYP